MAKKIWIKANGNGAIATGHLRRCMTIAYELMQMGCEVTYILSDDDSDHTLQKTTLEERKEIVEYCISHDRDYKNTAALYDVSYSQVYTWVKKYTADGDAGLEDRRGHHKTDDEVDELERLRRENLRLKRQLEEQGMLVELLKKVREFEGR